MGWKSLTNGELLTLAEAQFDLFVTSDQGLAYQQNLRGRQIAILQLSTNKLRLIQPLLRSCETRSMGSATRSSAGSKFLSE